MRSGKPAISLFGWSWRWPIVSRQSAVGSQQHSTLNSCLTGLFQLSTFRFQLLLIFIIFLSLSLQGQYYYRYDQRMIDSLERELSGAKDRARIDLLNQLALKYAKYNPERSDSLSSITLKKSTVSGYTKGEGQAYFAMGYLYYFQGDFLNTLGNFQKAIDLLEEAGDKKSLAHLYNLMTITLYFSRTEPDPGRYFDKALKIYKELDDREGVAITLIYMAGGGIRTGKDREAIQAILDYFKYKEGHAATSIFEAIAHAIIGDAYGSLQINDSALYYYLKAIQVYDVRNLEERAIKAQSIGSAGNYYLKLGKPDSAKLFYSEAFELSRPLNFIYGLLRTHYFIANLYSTQNNYEMVWAHCDSAIHYGRRIEMSGHFYDIDSLQPYIQMSEEIFLPQSKARRREIAWHYLDDTYSLWWKTLIDAGRYYEATQIVSPWNNVKDSINSYNRAKELKEINIRYETEKKERQLQQLSEENQLKELEIKQSRTILIALGGIFLLGLIIVILLIRQNRIRAEQEKTSLQQKLFRMQMNPHFIFNSLSSIQGFIIEKDHKAASRYLSKFSKLVRNILDYSAEDYVPLDKEISTIENYLELQKVRYEEKFDYKTEVDKKLETETMNIPPMLLQPFVENSIEHGIKHLNRKGNITVRIFEKEEKLFFEIEDDGIGREKAQELLKERDKSHKSLATKLTTERISAINRKRKEKILMEIEDLKDVQGKARGTLVRFVIPL